MAHESSNMALSHKKAKDISAQELWWLALLRNPSFCSPQAFPFLFWDPYVQVLHLSSFTREVCQDNDWEHGILIGENTTVSRAWSESE